MSRKGRETARNRARELREAAMMIEDAIEIEARQRRQAASASRADAVEKTVLEGENLDALVWHPQLGMCTVRQARARGGYQDSVEGEERDRQAMRLDPEGGQDCHGDDCDCSDCADCCDEEERDDAGNLEMARAVVARDEDEGEERARASDEPTQMAHLAKVVEATAARFHGILDEVVELRQLVKGLTVQNEVLTAVLAALRAKIRGEYLNNNEDLEGPAEVPPPMLN
jgi:hypothetical protein